MLKTLFASAAVFVVAAGPALAQDVMKPMPPAGAQVVPSEPVTPAERAQVRRDWNEMAREWEQRQRRGYVPPQGSMVPPTGGISSYGGPQDKISIAPSPVPMTGSGLQGLPQELTPAERAQVRRDWNQMAREWEQRLRSGYVPPAGQPLLPDQR
jgi:hypothetical protein